MIGVGSPVDMAARVGIRRGGRSPRPVLRAVFGLLFLALLAAREARSQDAPEVSITLEVGFGGEVRSGSAIPLHVRLDRSATALRPGAAELQRGEIVIEVETRSGAVDVERVPDIVLPAGGSRRFDRVVPTGRKVRVSFQADGRTLGSAEIEPAMSMLDRDRLVVTLSGRGFWLGFLHDSPLKAEPAPKPAEDEAEDSSLETLSGGRLHVGAAALHALPSHPAGWEGVDLVAVGDLGDLPPDDTRAEALFGWIRTGGRLLVIGGVHDLRRRGGAWERLAAGEPGEPVESPLPSEAAAAWNVPDLAGLRLVTRTWTGARGRDPFPAPGPPVVIRRAFGWGEVIHLNFDPTSPPLRGHPREPEFWAGVIKWALAGTQPASAEVFWAGAGDSARLDPPKARWVLAYTVLYALLVGPVNYLALRALERERWLWLTTPALAVLFFSGSVQLDQRAIDRPMVVRHLTVLWLGDDPTEPAEWTTYLDFFASSRSTVTLRISSDTSLALDPDAVDESRTAEESALERCVTANATELRFPVEKWARRRLVLRGRGEPPWTVAVEESARGRPQAVLPQGAREVFARSSGSVAYAAKPPAGAAWDWTSAPSQGAAPTWRDLAPGPRLFGQGIPSADQPLWHLFDDPAFDRTPLRLDANGGLVFLIDEAPETISLAAGPPAAWTVRTLVLRRFSDSPLSE